MPFLRAVQGALSRPVGLRHRAIKKVSSDEEEAQKHLQAAARKAGKTLSEEAAAALVAEAGTNWSVLSQELEKALLLVGMFEKVLLNMNLLEQINRIGEMLPR